ncbi:MAG TPA: ABC transporter permease [Dongiaceae bacterium]|jgi:simple sugar transport system permease protein|nr:ABC transporter permease [Dongiaceae bacterium]
MNPALPRWIDIGLIPLINVALAFLVSGLIVLAIGESPLDAVRLLVAGAFGDLNAWGYTLYFATNCVCTGLAVAVAFHCGLFNIGGEGQATMGGLGAGVVALAFDRYVPAPLLAPLVLIGCMALGALWALIPAYLQAYRGSHIVITTIMFNFIAASLMVYLMVNVFIQPGSQAPQSRNFTGGHLAYVHEMLGALGIAMPKTPLNATVFVAILACYLLWLFLWRTRWGYALRATGSSPAAAIYAGIDPKRMTLLAMAISGALAGIAGFNVVYGDQHRLFLDFVAGYGFTGIAVALMGRNHPVGIVLASLLFGALIQGGSDLSLEIPNINRDMVATIQGLVILFSGALAYLFRPYLERLFLRRRIFKTAEA